MGSSDPPRLPPGLRSSDTAPIRAKLTGEPNLVTRRAKTRAEFTLDAQTSGLTHGCARKASTLNLFPMNWARLTATEATS